jgi:hypothetical protein
VASLEMFISAPVYDNYEDSDEEFQTYLLFSFVLEDMELDDLEQKSHGDVPVEQPYLVNGTKILEKDFILLNQDDSLMDDQVIIFYQYEDPLEST